MNKLQETFNYLNDVRHLPDYQLERRVDVLFAVHLEQILNAFFKGKRQVELIAPEFPLENENKKAAPNRVDYLCYCRKTHKLIMVELKTDDLSTRDKQDKYLNIAQDTKSHDIIEYVRTVCTKSRAKHKYICLIKTLITKGLLVCNKKFKTFESRKEHKKGIKQLMRIIRDKKALWVSPDLCDDIELVYIKPLGRDHRTIDYR
jgi:hypothetical protein